MEDRHQRGVFTGHFTDSGGHEILVAVDSDGRAVAHVTVTTPSNRDRLIGEMWDLLNATDPVPRFRVMR